MAFAGIKNGWRNTCAMSRQNNLLAQRKVIVVIYPYFFPGFKAGGPIQSLVNMITALSDHYEFKVITSAFDLNDKVTFPGIRPSAWNKVRLSGLEEKIAVWYHASKNIGMVKMAALLEQASPDIIFLNGLFTPWSFTPLILKKTGRLKNVRVILSPRGMLQSGALQSKPLKKKLFLKLFKSTGLFNDLLWHATGMEENNDIADTIGGNIQIALAANIAKKPLKAISLPPKIKGELNLVYLSLIAEKKNLLLLIRALKKTYSKISLDIYGPVKESDYWQRCRQACENLPANIKVQYKGEVQPHQVQGTLQRYDAFISLTRGENFGHALYESLSVGRPLITSYYTPWVDLEFHQAGWNLRIEDEENLSSALDGIANTDGAAFHAFCHGAWYLSKQYYNSGDFINSYRNLFV